MKTLALRGFAVSALFSAGCAANAGGAPGAFGASGAPGAPTTETTSASVPAMPARTNHADRSEEARAFTRRGTMQAAPGAQERDLREVASWKARCAAADADACTMVDRDRLR